MQDVNQENVDMKPSGRKKYVVGLLVTIAVVPAASVGAWAVHRARNHSAAKQLVAKQQSYFNLQPAKRESLQSVYKALEAYGATKKIYLTAEDVNKLPADPDQRLQQKMIYMRALINVVKVKRPGIVVHADIVTATPNQAVYQIYEKKTRAYFDTTVKSLLAKPGITVDDINSTLGAAAAANGFKKPGLGYAFVQPDLSDFEELTFIQKPGSIADTVNKLTVDAPISPTIDYGYQSFGMIKLTSTTPPAATDSWTKILNAYK